MAVTKVIVDWEGRGATTDENGVQTFKRRWKVTTDSDATGEPAVVDGVVAFDPSAALYRPHPDWAWAVCRKVTADPHKGPRVWVVNAEYSSAPFRATGTGSGATGGSGGSSTPNPTSPSPAQSNSTPADQRPPTITITRKEVSKVLEYDAVAGTRVVNTVVDPFDPLPEVFRSHHLITITIHRLPADLNWTARSAFMDSLNDAGFQLLGRTYPAKTLRCTAYDVESVWETGASGMTFFFKLTVQLEYDPDGWQPKILNTGRRKKVAGKAVAIVDAAGQPVADPVPLTAAGVPVAPGGSYHYVEPAGYVPKDWSTILA